MKSVMLISVLALVVGSMAQAETRGTKHKRRSSNYESYSAPESSSAGGGGGHKMAGCGLGSMAIEDGSKWAQVGAAFLNGTGFQTFAISFGTSNCTEDGVATAARERDAFIEANLTDLRRDVSVGSGAYLSSLASLYGCKGEASLHFGNVLHNSQDKILNSADAEVPGAINAVVSAEKAACEG